MNNKILRKMSFSTQILSDRNQIRAPIAPSFRKNSKTFLENTESALNTEADALIKIIFPCADLYNLIELSMSITCKQDGFLNFFGANALSLTANTFMIVMTVFLFVLLASRHHQQCRLMGVNALCVHSAVQMCHTEWNKTVKAKRRATQPSLVP